MTRRILARLLAASIVRPVIRCAGAADLSTERRYRADAQILILSLPILRRSGVGGGSALWREWTEPSGLNRLFEFNAYSDPDRAAGLNRVGVIRETSCGTNATGRELNYSGVMTASPEETAEEANRALHSTAVEAAYSAIKGRIVGSRVETASAHFIGPARLSPYRRKELLARAEKALADAPVRPPEFHSDGMVPAPFLHTLADSLRNPGPVETRYVYSGRLYRLWLRRAADPHAAAYFRDRGIIGRATGVVRVSGKLRRETGGKETEFRVWIESGVPQPVPLRIDFQPKAYLRLVMEAL